MRWSLFESYGEIPVPNQPESICVVDDDASVLKALRRLLHSAGLPMIPFADPRLFLEHAKDHVVALAIIDVWMPELNGLEVQRLFHDLAPNTPVILMTGRDEPGIESIALAQGAVAFLTKPFDDTVFLETIHAALPTRH
ncbi:MAG TPA: response regulator [Chthoniobacterales bacterium]|jgi:FixJ family two-component response regulator|nr:response regulator [Chthoniobacterales bacterium]